jgi:hypothetical protein
MSHLEDLSERPVMSGLGFFLDDRMAVAVLEDGLCLIAETVANSQDEVARPFEFAGRIVEGWVCIPEESLDETRLAEWLARGVAGLGLTM